MKLILFLWQLPQNILGAIFYLYFKLSEKITEKESYKGINVFWVKDNTFSGVSLGTFIFINVKFQSDDRNKKHEYGHCIQSKWTGPLYLIIIGIPSYFRFSYDVHILSKTKSSYYRYKWYYSGYPEKSADKLGEVKRF